MHNRSFVYGLIGLASVIGWIVLWSMAYSHAAELGSFSALGPGMQVIDTLAGLFGGEDAPIEGVWGDICRAFATAGNAHVGAWSWQQGLLALLMWQVMAVAMMLPTAAPVIAAYGDIRHAALDKGKDAAPSSIFVAGYLLVWALLGLLATLLQWALNIFGVGTADLMSFAPLAGGAVLILAGAYQWSALKEACLSQCRSPMRFFMSHWRDGNFGALRMGARHGIYCAGCCWALMALMFVGGTMNLIWMALLTAAMLIEKVTPRAKLYGRIAGGLFIVWGVLLSAVGLNLLGI